MWVVVRWAVLDGGRGGGGGGGGGGDGGRGGGGEDGGGGGCNYMMIKGKEEMDKRKPLL